MKKIIVLSLFLSSVYSFAQVKTNQNINQGTINNQSAFLDASSSSDWNRTPNIGKGLVFPRTDLKALTTLVATPAGLSTSYPNRLDGMVVYNTASGTAGIGGTKVEPGFYYYENKTSNLNGGRWLPLGGNASQSVGSTEVSTPVVVDTKQVYAVKGSFTSNGSTKARINFPEDIKSIYSIRIYKKDGVQGTKIVHTQLYSYDLTARTGDNVVFGSGVMSTSIPEGDYEYVLEYMK